MPFLIKAHAFHDFVTAETSNFMGLSQLPGKKKNHSKSRQIMEIISRVGYSNELRWIWISTAEWLVHPRSVAVCVTEGALSRELPCSQFILKVDDSSATTSAPRIRCRRVRSASWQPHTFAGLQPCCFSRLHLCPAKRRSGFHHPPVRTAFSAVLCAKQGEREGTSCWV